LEAALLIGAAIIGIWFLRGVGKQRSLANDPTIILISSKLIELTFPQQPPEALVTENQIRDAMETLPENDRIRGMHAAYGLIAPSLDESEKAKVRMSLVDFGVFIK